MKVLIISSAAPKVESYYLEGANKVSTFLASQNYDLVFGGSSLSLMGICYQVFSKKKRKIYAYTINKYEEDLQSLKEAIAVVKETTFDLKKAMFQACNLIVCLPGGIGTLSELLSYLEEKRTNDKNKPILIYDENNYYESLELQVDHMIKEGFVDKGIKQTFKIVDNMEGFKKEIKNIKNNGLLEN